MIYLAYFHNEADFPLLLLVLDYLWYIAARLWALAADAGAGSPR